MNSRPNMSAAGLLACALSISAMTGAHAAAQDYPNRPIRLIVPFAPGGGSDFMGRLIGQKLTEQMGQQVVVDNRPGAASLVGTQLAARAAPDGYTLILADAGFTINIAFFKDPKYDAQKDFAPVSVIAGTPYILVVNPNLPYTKSLKEFIAAAKAQPGKLAIGSAGSGSGTHMTGELFKLRAGIDLTHVPYKSVGPAMADVVAGQIPATFSTPPTSLPLAKAGRLRILASAGSQRSPLLPEVPTFAEQGVKDINVSNWYSIMSVGGTPRPVVARLHDEIHRAIATPDMRERLANAGLEPAPNSPEEFRAMIMREIKRWTEVVKEARIQQQ